jgi:hypothetical protein
MAATALALQAILFVASLEKCGVGWPVVVSQENGRDGGITG